MARISVQIDDFDIAAEIAALQNGDLSIGGLVTFTGTVRDVGGTLDSMTLEHYPGMTEKQLQLIAGQAEERWPLAGCTIIHRYGTLKPGENIVLVITASAHRKAAFEAAEFLMDFLKSEAPFWKKEDGQEGSLWVDASDRDTVALERWQKTKTE